MAGNDNSNDGLWMIFLVCAIIVGIALAIWFIFTPQVLQLYLWIRQAEMMLASLWTSDDYTISIIAGGREGSFTFGQARQMLDTLTPQALLSGEVNKLEIVTATTRAVLMPMRIPVGIAFALMAYYALFRGPTSFHRTTFNLDALIAVQSKVFRVIHPIVNFNPSKTTHRAPGSPVPAVLPLFAEALSPEEWLAFHKIPITDNVADRDEMQKAFEKQLLGPWQGAQKLQPYMQILLAAFALKTVRKRSECDDLLGRLALCWDHKTGLKLSKDADLLRAARKILRDKNISTKTIQECNRHAYVTTALLGALNLARTEGGVLAPAQFVWLRGHDRTLWYPLNNLGRQAFHAEAMGAMSHYRAEKQVQRPIPKPMMQDAIKSMTGYAAQLRDNGTPIPPLDFSMVKNKKDPGKNTGILKPSGT